METIQSALIRQALRQHLKRLHESELEERDRRGYLAQPQREEEFRVTPLVSLRRAVRS
jgi:hypothetical protein